ncbi:MAG TPA: HAMP domain-containing protein [Firmicutes bacterium]|nr:HAMP domain-containing protein [Bacillota bacterium]
MRWANLKIGTKIGLSFSLILGLLLALSIFNFIGVSRVYRSGREVLNTGNLMNTLTLREIDHLLWSERLNELVDLGDPSEFDLELDPTRCRLGQWLNSEERRQVEELSPELAKTLQELSEHHVHMHGTAARIRDVLETAQAKQIFWNETKPALEELRARLTKTRTLLEEYRLAAADQMSHFTQQSRDRSIYLPVIALVLGVVFSAIIGRGITKPIGLLTATMAKAAAGDLTVSVDYQGQDEIGVMVDSFNRMLGALKEVVAASRKAVAETVSASQMVATANEELSASIDQIACSATEFADSSVRISQKIMNINQAAQETGELARTGSAKINSCLESIQSIEGASEETVTAMHQLREAAKEIVTVVNVISEIADQTNLLSLNAAIEAANAGEYGQGFAVVADQIRKLAVQTKASLEKVDDLVSNLHALMDVAANSTNLSREKVAQGAITVKESTESLNAIVARVAEIIDQVQTIAEMTQQQAATSQQIAAATQEQSALTQGLADSSHQLANIAQRLEEIISQLSV